MENCCGLRTMGIGKNSSPSRDLKKSTEKDIGRCEEGLRNKVENMACPLLNAQPFFKRTMARAQSRFLIVALSVFQSVFFLSFSFLLILSLLIFHIRRFLFLLLFLLLLFPAPSLGPIPPISSFLVVKIDKQMLREKALHERGEENKSQNKDRMEPIAPPTRPGFGFTATGGPRPCCGFSAYGTHHSWLEKDTAFTL